MEEHVLLKAVRVMDDYSPWHNQLVDVHLSNGRIEEIGPQLATQEGQTLHVPGSMISPGWVDGQAHFREPGEETKEGLSHGLRVAAGSGFTSVAILPSTHPCVDHSVAVRNVLATSERASREGVAARALPMACITEQAQGEQLSEMHDLSEAGAVAFTDDKPLDRVGLLQRALTYGESHGKAIIDVPQDEDLNSGGVMHEGIVSTEMGLVGVPSEAESLRISRDLDVLSYAGGRLHFALITTAESVELIRQAKAKGLAVTCATSAPHLAYIDEDLRGFVGALRVRMPFRSKEDREALRQGVLDGTIDAVVSDHRPEDLEHHDVEFMLSPEGVASLPSTFALALHGLSDAAPDKESALAALLKAFTVGPRNVLSLETNSIERGNPCNLTWFHPAHPHTPLTMTKGVNLPPLPHGLEGKVLGVFLNTNQWLADS